MTAAQAVRPVSSSCIDYSWTAQLRGCGSRVIGSVLAGACLCVQNCTWAVVRLCAVP
jgi:hypothetical protein